MKILEIIPQLSSGGAERFTVDLCNELAEKHDVTLIMLHRFEGLDFYRKELSPQIKLVSLNKKKGVDLGLIFKLYQLIKKGEFDVVHTHLRAIIYSLLAITRYHKQIKFVHTLHNDAFREAGGKVSLIIRKILFHQRWVSPVAISEASADSVEQLYGFNPILIHNGRNISRDFEISNEIREEIKKYKKNKDTRVLVNLARFEPQKRQPLLARVVARLSQEGYNLTLLFIGSKKTLEMIEEVKNISCSGIHILGEKSNPLEYLKAADAYCLCSSYEGMPISLIEALGLGTIPICTPVGGVVNMIRDGKNGFLSENISEESYYITLRHFLEMTDGELAAMKKDVIMSYPPYSMNKCATKYLELFLKTI